MKIRPLIRYVTIARKKDIMHKDAKIIPISTSFVISVKYTDMRNQLVTSQSINIYTTCSWPYSRLYMIRLN